jgi:hypothetical protein
MNKPVTFETELIMGHKNIAAVLVPFAPERVWKSTAVKVDAPYSRKPQDAYLVRGTIDGTPFDGWIGKRRGRRFIIIDQALRKSAGVTIGDIVELTVEPRSKASPPNPTPKPRRR